MDNTLATQHLNITTDEAFFRRKCQEINERIQRIIAENGLKGNWTLSEDYKWLVKIGE